MFTVNVEFAVPLATGVTEAGDKLQVTVGVAGEMPHDKLTAALKLFNEVRVIVPVVIFPAVVVTEFGRMDKE